MDSSSLKAMILIACGVLVSGGCTREPATPASTADSALRAAQIAELEARADRVKDSNDIKRLQRQDALLMIMKDGALHKAP